MIGQGSENVYADSGGISDEVLYCEITSNLSITFLVTLFTLTTLATGQEQNVLSLDAHIPLPNVTGRIDHFSVDLKGERLLVAAVENHTLEVIDLKLDQRVRTISELAEPQGVFYDPATNHYQVQVQIPQSEMTSIQDVVMVEQKADGSVGA